MRTDLTFGSTGQLTLRAARGRPLAATAVTLGFAALMTASGVLFLLAPEPLRLALLRLGYPAYLLRILGGAKLLGVVGLLAPRHPLLREWAYAGFAFDLLGAIASHLWTGTASSAGPALFALALLVLSYRLRRGAEDGPGPMAGGGI